MVEQAAASPGAGGQESTQSSLEGPCLTGTQLGQAERGIDGGIEADGPGAVGEAVRVERPDEGPVREAEIGELLLAQRDPKTVEVLDDGVGRQMGQQPRVKLAAG